MTELKHSHQKIQEEQYLFPYHYIPQYQNSKFQQNFNFSWGFEYLSYLHFIIDQIKLNPTSSILDVGCGDGRFLHEAQKQLNNTNLYGIDYSQKAIDLAKAINPHIQFIAGDIKDNKILNKKFELITLIETLEHIPPEESASFLKGIKQFLEPGGRLLLTVPSTNVPVTPKHFRHFNDDTLKDALKDSFEIESIVYLNRINSFGFNILKRFLTNPLFICNFQPFKNFTYRYYLKNCMIAKKNNAGRLYAVCK